MKLNFVNQAKTTLSDPLEKIVEACQFYVDQCLAAIRSGSKLPIWAVEAQLAITSAPVPGESTMFLLDSSDVEGALGYHDMDVNVPMGKIFVKTVQESGESLSTTVSHEVAELLVDPFCESLVINNETGTIYPYEVCDAVEEGSFDAPNGIKLSNFVFPEWFEGWNTTAGKYDWLGVLTKPFELDKGGYITAIHEGKVRTLWGSMEKQARWSTEDRRGHRLEDLFTHNVVDIGIASMTHRRPRRARHLHSHGYGNLQQLHERRHAPPQ